MNKIVEKLQDYYKTDNVGTASVVVFEITAEDVFKEKMRSAWSGSYNEVAGLKPGKYVKLLIGNNVVMSNTDMEIQTNEYIISVANGHVLIGGLGLGMIVLPIQEKDDVKSITVVESNKDVIDLVTKYLPLNDKVTIVHGDIFKYAPTQKFDTIYCDIWTNITADNWPEMKTLTNKFMRHVNRENPRHILTHWRKTYVHDLYKQMNKQSRRWKSYY